MAAPPTSAEVVRETRCGLIVRLRLEEGLTYREISERVGRSISQCHRDYQRALARRRGDLDIERHRDEVFADLELLLDMLRPLVHGSPPLPDAICPTMADVDTFLKVLAAKVKLLGLNAPRESRIQQDIRVTEDHSESQEFLGRVADWWSETQRRRAVSSGRLDAIEVPAFPSSKTNGSRTNGHMSWQTIVDNPGPDTD